MPEYDHLSSPYTASEFEADLQNNKLNAGDTLVIVSDGVLELKNCSEEMLGDKKVKNLISNAYAEKSLITAQQIIEQQLAEYLGESEQLDDITLVALRSPCL
ncbi:MAG: SpoIIE family protein phosphatase [Marinomonas sp.]|uniref:SpoIIE family protein phosphatase n=1 Tax=Marinomonas sp. TaxID=1904862 RepID=UPI003F9A5B5E